MRVGPGELRWREPLWVWLIVLGTMIATETAVMILLPWMLPPDPPLLAEAAVDAFLLTSVVAPVLWALLVRPLRDAYRVREQFLAELFTSIEADRRRTAHELHDGVGQSLTLIVSGLNSALPAEMPPDLSRRLAHLSQLAKQALRDVKRVALGLRPSLLDDLGLAPAIERVVEDLRHHHTVEAELDVGAVAGVRLPDDVETALFRIVQEALANVVAHARASRVAVHIRRPPGRVELSVADNGVGMPPSAQSGLNTGHLGLTGMRERANLLGGELLVESTPGKGTRLLVRLPVGGPNE